MGADEKRCFVIAPIGESDSDTRKRSNQILRHIIRPAAAECGYKAVRADEIDKPGIITSQVIQHVVSDELVIADLTDTNPNVFYELAIRHAIRKPLVQIIQKGQRIPFDVAGTRTVHFDHHDLDSVDEAKNQIIEQILASEAAPNEIETPISVSLDLQLLRQSENPEERSLADMVSVVSDLRAGFNKLEERIGGSKGGIGAAEFQELMEVLPRRIAKEIAIGPRGVKAKNTVDPFIVRELMHVLPRKAGGTLGILVALSFYKDRFPWMYEIGMEAYRRANAGDWNGARQAIRDLRIMVEMLLKGPWINEWIGGDKEAFMMLEELPFLLERFIEEALEQQK